MSIVTLTIPACSGCCGGCPNVETFALTLAEGSICACVSSGGGLSGSIQWEATPFDGVYELDTEGFDPDFEAWQVAFGPKAFNRFTATACDGDPTEDSSNVVGILICNAGKLSFRIVSNDRTAFTGSLPYFFLATDITIGEPFDNELVACDTATPGLDPEFPAVSVIVSGTGGTGLIEI